MLKTIVEQMIQYLQGNTSAGRHCLDLQALADEFKSSWFFALRDSTFKFAVYSIFANKNSLHQLKTMRMIYFPAC